MKIEQFMPLIFDEIKFVRTPYIKDTAERALMYIKAGFPVNLSGPSGTGKTTLALYLASKIGRPVVLLHGGDQITSASLVGGNYGYRKKLKVDNYIHSVEELEESMQFNWVEGMLGTACRSGMTLVYDEFTRSKPEVNNLLLSILEEKTLSLPGWQKEKHYLKVHPDFKAIFTSNPAEYAGVYRAQVALIDRMVNMELDRFDPETEAAIASAQSGLPLEDAAFIVKLVQGFREKSRLKDHTSIRSPIRIATIVSRAGIKATLDDELFCKVLNDVLLSEITDAGPNVRRSAGKILQDLVTQKSTEEEQ